MLNIMIDRLGQVGEETATTSVDHKNIKSILVKSIPSSTIEYMLSCIEKHHSMRNEMKGVVVSWN
jgi:hypothetical protein